MRYFYFAAALCVFALYVLFGHPSLEAYHSVAVDELDFGLCTAVCGLVLIASFHLVRTPAQPVALAGEPMPAPYVWPMTGSTHGADETELEHAFADAMLSGTGMVRTTRSDADHAMCVIGLAHRYPDEKAFWAAIAAGTITTTRIAPHVIFAGDPVPTIAPHSFFSGDLAPLPAVERAGVTRAKKAAAKRAKREARNRRAAMAGVPA